MARLCLKRRAAYSLLFAFVMSTLYLLFISNAASRTQTLLRETPSQASLTQAQTLAQLAAQAGVQALNGHTFGYEPSSNEILCTDSDLDDECDSWGEYEIHALAEVNTQENDGNFYLPIPGTGTAGNPDFCSIDRDHYDADHPCNWNAWRYGETVVLPLFVDDGFGGVSLPADRGFRSLTFRLRTPCNNGEDMTEYATCERALLNLDGEIASEGDVFVTWELSATSTDGGQLSLSPVDDINTSRGARASAGSQRSVVSNTEFYELLLNEGLASNTYVIDELNSEEPWTEFNALLMRTDLSEIYWNLQLSAPLFDEDGQRIPRLEYQVFYDADQSFPDNKILAWGRGFSRFLGDVFVGSYFLERNLTGLGGGSFGLSN